MPARPRRNDSVGRTVLTGFFSIGPITNIRGALAELDALCLPKGKKQTTPRQPVHVFQVQNHLSRHALDMNRQLLQVLRLKPTNGSRMS
jgi:hypothetical protein